MACVECQFHGQLFFTVRGETEREIEPLGLIYLDRQWKLPLFVETEAQRDALVLALSGMPTTLTFPNGEVHTVVFKEGTYPVYLPMQVDVMVLPQVI